MEPVSVPEARAKRVRKQTDKDFVGEQLRPQKQSKPAPKRATYVAPPPPPPVPLNVFIPPSVALSTYDKASQLTLSKDQLLCHGCEVCLYELFENVVLHLLYLMTV
jgi:hypothetical protein